MAEAFGIACDELVSLDFRCGSRSDLRRHHLEGLFLGVKQTQSVRKRTWGLNVGCQRQSRRAADMAQMSLPSQEQKSRGLFTHVISWP